MNKLNSNSNYLSKSLTRQLLFYVSLFSVLLTTFQAKRVLIAENNHEIKQKNRNLQYALNSIYYNLVYPANNITGTGDFLKDVPYKVQCMILACNSGCCVGEIDNMRCGLASDCQIYLDYSKLPGMVAAIVIPIGVFVLLVAFFVYLNKFRKYSCSGAFCMCLGCLFVVTIPFVLYHLFFKKQKEYVTPGEKVKEK